MIRAEDIKKISQELEILEVVTMAFSEVAFTQMKETRSGVLNNREFIGGLSLIFEDVRNAYALKLKNERKSSNKDRITFLSHNGKTVSVLLSANGGLYGDIISDTFRSFYEHVSKDNTEVVIVGSIGLSLFTSAFPDRAYTYFDIEDHIKDSKPLAALTRHIVQYDEVHIFYGKFHNILMQKPDMLSVNSKIDLNVVNTKAKKYLFEPDIESLLQFFEEELFGSLLTQTVQESSLSKLGSRVLAMDAASQRISDERKKVSKLELAIKHRKSNKEQLNNLSGILSMR